MAGTSKRSATALGTEGPMCMIYTFPGGVTIPKMQRGQAVKQVLAAGEVGWFFSALFDDKMSSATVLVREEYGTATEVVVEWHEVRMLALVDAHGGDVSKAHLLSFTEATPKVTVYRGAQQVAVFRRAREVLWENARGSRWRTGEAVTRPYGEGTS